MLGRRLDRYVTSFFVWHFVVCLVAVLGLYIVVDTFTELDEFVKHGKVLEQIRWIATYHLYNIPLLLGQFLPIVTLLAGIISLARLATYNELNAMKAAGVSMQRAMAPVLLCTLIIAVLAAANQELLLPRLESKIREVEFTAKGKASTSLWFYDEKSRTTLEAEELDNRVEGKALRRVEIVADPEVGPDGQVLRSATLRAAKAIWAGRWIFLLNGHTTDVRGKTHPFDCRLVRVGALAVEFDPARKRAGRLADGTPAYLMRGRADLPARRFARAADGEEPSEVLLDPLGNRPLSVQFDSVELTKRYRVIFNGHITGSYAGEETQPPIALRVALWHKGKWIGRAQTYREEAKGTAEAHRRLIVYDGQAVPIHAPPAELVRKRVDPSLKSFAYLLGKARENPRNRRLRQRIFVLLHARFAFPFANIVLLLMAIPLLFQQEGGKSTWIGVGLALLVSLCFYFFTYFCQFAGQDPNGVFGGMPALAAWLPVGVFGLGGGILFSNINT